MLSEWACPGDGDRAWLLYSANYLFRTGGIRWALDPLSLRRRLPSADEADVSALAALDYIVLSHRHADHLDLPLLYRLRDFPACWIVPPFLVDELRDIDLPAGKLIPALPMEPLQLGALQLTPFEGLHWEFDAGYPGNRRGVPAMGYLAEFSQKRWLLPGDTRSYDLNQLPDFGPVDGVFAHLWLGRGQAPSDRPALLEQFCRFFLALKTSRLVITHLKEVGRSVGEYWDDRHYQQARSLLLEYCPTVQVESAIMGNSIRL